MKVSLNWLKEYVDVKLPIEQYVSKMVMSGTGVEGYEEIGGDVSGVVVGRIESITKHPNADSLQICQVNVGSQTIQIVTGATNVFAGALVPVAMEGALLPSGVKIKKGKLRGEESFGMLCSGPEIGVPEYLYPSCGDEGILILNEEYELGADIKPIVGLGDTMVDFEILANRPDCLSVWGMARETAAALDEYMTMPIIEVKEAGGNINDYIDISVKDNDLCPRYVGRVIKNVRIASSPLWLRAYLHAAGVRSINNIVDITNYIMLETGHPMHAFDLSKVRDGKIIVRRAKEGEKLITLDGKERILNSEMLVIADAQNATGLAGIMGGEESEIGETTATVLFECAAFNRTNIRVTSRALGMRTESSGRFERGVCPDTALEAINRACQMVNQLDAGDVVCGIIDIYPNPMEQRIVKAEVARVAGRVGIDICGETMVDILDSLNIQTTLTDGVLLCEVPAYRMDIENEADISEEVLRLYGYDKLPSTLMRGEFTQGGRSEYQKMLDGVKTTLVGMGAFESLTYSFISPKWLENLRLEPNDKRLDPVRIINPLGDETSVMRTTLAPSMLNTLSTNINRGNSGGILFEASKSFEKTENDLPNEHSILAIGMYGDDVDFYRLKDVVTCLATGMGVSIEVFPGGDCYYHPGRKAEIFINGERIGQMGEVHPDTSERFGIDSRRVYLAEIDLDMLNAKKVPVGAMKPLPRFPAVSRDISIVIANSQPVGPVMATIKKAGGFLMESVSLFDVYRSEKLGTNLKSVAFAMSLRAPDRTLTDEEINTAFNKVVLACQKEYGAEIRK